MQNKPLLLRKCLICQAYLGTSGVHLQMGLFRECSMSTLAKSANEISKLGEGKIVYMVKDSRIEKNKQNVNSKIFPLTITNGAKVLKIKNI